MRARGNDLMLVRAVHISEGEKLRYPGLLALALYTFSYYYLPFLIAVHATSGVCIRVDLLGYIL